MGSFVDLGEKETGIIKDFYFYDKMEMDMMKSDADRRSGVNRSEICFVVECNVRENDEDAGEDVRKQWICME